LTKLADRAIDYFNKKSQDKEDKEEETVKNKKSKNNK
jgi:hypothetical protein